MSFKLFFTVFFTFSLATGSIAQNKKAKKEPIHRMVFQLSTPDTAAYRAVIRQLNNVLNHWNNAQIEVVIHNKGIGFMRKDQSIFEQDIQALKDRGVVFAVCENTLKQQNLKKEQILQQAIFVPVGLAEIVTKQEEGWAYLKAGF
ncbi:MAG: DsrE family protein [Runella sp.]